MTRSNNNEFAIIPTLRVVEGRGLERTTAAAKCMEGSSGKGMFAAGGCDVSLRVYCVSLHESSDGGPLPKLCLLNLRFSGSEMVLKR